MLVVVSDGLSVTLWRSHQARGHQTFFIKGWITARLAAAGRAQIENRYTIFRISIDSN